MSEQELETGPEPEIEAEAQTPVETPEPPAADPEVEAIAKRYGWKPKDAFSRDPEGWVDASRFLELAPTKAKMLRDSEREKAELREQLTRLTKVTESVVERARREEREKYEAQIAAIQAKTRQAVETGDVEEWERLEAARQRIAPPPVAQADLPPTPDWAKDPEMRAYGFHVIEQTPGAKALPAARQIALAEKQVREAFPERFSAPEPQPARPARVDGGGLATGASGPRKRTISDLPLEAQAAYKSFVAAGIKMTPEQYVADYMGNS
jgi:hypothetical protein